MEAQLAPEHSSAKRLVHDRLPREEEEGFETQEATMLRNQEVGGSSPSYPTTLKRRLRPVWSLDKNEWKKVPGYSGTWEILREYIPERRYHCSIDEAIYIGLDYRIYIRSTAPTKPTPV